MHSRPAQEVWHAPPVTPPGASCGSPVWRVVQQPRRGFRLSAPGSPTVVVAQAKVAATVVAATNPAVRVAVVAAHSAATPPLKQQGEAAGPLRASGDIVDAAYEQKEFFERSGRREAKQSWSVKARKKTDYQVEKRKQQSQKQKAANVVTEDDMADFSD